MFEAGRAESCVSRWGTVGGTITHIHTLSSKHALHTHAAPNKTQSRTRAHTTLLYSLTAQ